MLQQKGERVKVNCDLVQTSSVVKNIIKWFLQRIRRYCNQQKEMQVAFNNSICFHTNLELFCFEENFAAISNSDGKTPTLQSTQESKGGVFENKRREISLNTKLTFSGMKIQFNFNLWQKNQK